eukprot:gene28016-34809_t
MQVPVVRAGEGEFLGKVLSHGPLEQEKPAQAPAGGAASGQVLAALLGGLADPSWQVREEAAGTLGKLRLPAAAAPLTAALDDGYWQVRLRAARSLGRLRHAGALAALAAQRPVSPAASAVSVAQDRAREKAHFVACGVPCAPYAVIETAEQLAAVSSDLLPGILKTARMGYDGKGQVRVKTPAELAAAWDSVGKVPCVLEKMLPLALECSVIVARGADGATVHLPVQRNLHRDGILAVTEDGSLVVNEIAPRPHNSGHYSQNACDVSQFELQVRTMAGLPLTQPRQHSPAVMLNLLGDLWFAHGNAAQTPPWAEVLALPLLASQNLHGAASFGILSGAHGAGSLIGMALSGAGVRLRFGTFGATLLAVDAIAALLFAPLGFITATWQGAGLLLAMGVLGGFIQIAVFSWIQGSVPPRMLGRAMSIFMFIFMGLAPLSAAAIGALLLHVTLWCCWPSRCWPGC